ncbi:MAG: MBL fold metallo-hydrolase [Promethearchaeota archaeon]
MDDELVILGSGGGRHHIRTQHRATGGLLYKFNGIQAHLDPGPGALVRLIQYGEDPTKTELFIVTHVHIDHFNDISAIIEASREYLHDKEFNYFKKGTLITTKDVLPFISNYHRKMLEKTIVFNTGATLDYKGVKITGTKVIHSPKIDGFGIKFELENYTIAFSSDTMVFKGFSEQFSGVDVLILHLLRPDSVTCRRHLCTDEVIPYLKKIYPPLKGLIITHFGSYMDGFRSKDNKVPRQVEKLKNKTKILNVISAEDGLKIKIKDLLK